jgi:transcriptional regulator with XRE-family HTH domain
LFTLVSTNKQEISMGELGNRIRQVLAEKGMSQAELSRAVVVKQQTISYICSVDSPASTSRYATKIAGALGVNPMWLQTGQGDKHDPVVRIEYGGVELSLKRVPLLRSINDPSHSVSLMTDAKVSDGAFALEIKDESMAPMFKPGDRVVIDLATQPEPGDFVLAKHAGQTLFRRYRCRGTDAFELAPMNADWSPVLADPTSASIVGVMVEHRSYRRSRG